MDINKEGPCFSVPVIPLRPDGGAVREGFYLGTTFLKGLTFIFPFYMLSSATMHMEDNDHGTIC